MPKRKKKKNNPFAVLIAMIVIMWLVEGINVMAGHSMNQWGIWPRTTRGLIGIPICPFLHGGIAHLAMNTGPLAVLGCLILGHGRNVFFKTTLFIIFVGGFGLWAIGRPSFHVGASGLIFGYFGFLVWRGIVRNSIGSLMVSLVTFFIYGGMLWGVLPTAARISWEGHLCGLAAGIAAVRLERP